MNRIPEPEASQFFSVNSGGLSDKTHSISVIKFNQRKWGTVDGSDIQRSPVDTPRMINMEQNHGGLEDHFPF